MIEHRKHPKKGFLGGGRRGRPVSSQRRARAAALLGWTVALGLMVATANAAPPCRPCAGLATTEPAVLIDSFGTAPQLTEESKRQRKMVP